MITQCFESKFLMSSCGSYAYVFASGWPSGDGGWDRTRLT